MLSSLSDKIDENPLNLNLKYRGGQRLARKILLKTFALLLLNFFSRLLKLSSPNSTKFPPKLASNIQNSTKLLLDSQNSLNIQQISVKNSTYSRKEKNPWKTIKENFIWKTENSEEF
jgi:hypothetical protein